MAFSLKQNDTSPSLQATLKDAAQNPVDLEGATVKLHMKSAEGILKVNAAMTVVDQNNGIIQYDWQSGDTDTAGTYYVEFQVTYADSSVETFPNDGNKIIVIRPELN
jgi:hypothetical protein